jgi:D-erythro-7,8-dihydroneopterin triphosphate epimerase
MQNEFGIPVRCRALHRQHGVHARLRGYLPWADMELDRILIKDLSVSGILGINPEERVNEQEILVNAVLWTDIGEAAHSDDIADAVNYRTVTKALIDHIRNGQPQLVERLVQELVDVCFAMEPRIMQVEMTVEKPGALRHARSVGVSIKRRREPVSEV